MSDILSKTVFYLNDFGVCCAIGQTKEDIANALFLNTNRHHNLRQTLTFETGFLNHEAKTYVGRVSQPLPEIPHALKHYNTRNNRLLLKAFLQIQGTFEHLTETIPPHRIAVVIGTSTSGVFEGEMAFFQWYQQGKFPENYDFNQQEIADNAEFLADYLGLKGLTFTLSTACSSSVKAFTHGAELLQADLCDLVLVGGVDSLCHLTLNGFGSLGVLSEQPANPMSKNRDGISIGEGAGLFIMSKHPSALFLAGTGESSDGYTMTAPDPEGTGAELAMNQALNDAGLQPDAIDYINLHGTATPQNDETESKAVNRVFGKTEFMYSSTKSLTGHTLGACGAIEACLCALMLLDDYNPQRHALPHAYDEKIDDSVDLSCDKMAGFETILKNTTKPQYALSNAFAFGGSNASMILGCQKLPVTE